MRKIAPIAIAFLLVACGGESKDATQDGAGTETTQGMSTGGMGADGMNAADMIAAEPLTGDPGRVVAKVGKEEITLRQVDILAGTLQRNRPGASQAQLQKFALDNLIDQEVLLRAANERKIGPSDEDFTAAVGQILSQFPNPEAFDQAVQQQGMTRAEFDENFRTELTIQKLIEEAFLDTIAVSPEEARAYYETNSQEFQTPATVHARHILMRVDANATPEEDTAARVKAEAALDRVKGGEDFATVANEVTEDPTNAGKGGDLGFFPRERMVAPFADAAFALQPGQISDLVKTQFGYHVIKVEERRDAGLLAFDDVSDQLVQNLEQQATGVGIRSFLEREKAKLKIEREM